MVAPVCESPTVCHQMPLRLAYHMSYTSGLWLLIVAMFFVELPPSNGDYQG